MIHARETACLDLPQEAAVRLFLDYKEWPTLFPATIRDVTLVSEARGRLVLDVHHREGRVRNVVVVESPEEIVVEEWKRRYSARFTYRFVEAGDATRLDLVGDIRLRFPYAVLDPVLEPYVRRQMRKFVLEPMQAAAKA